MKRLTDGRGKISFAAANLLHQLLHYKTSEEEVDVAGLLLSPVFTLHPFEFILNQLSFLILTVTENSASWIKGMRVCLPDLQALK